MQYFLTGSICPAHRVVVTSSTKLFKIRGHAASFLILLHLHPAASVTCYFYYTSWPLWFVRANITMPEQLFLSKQLQMLKRLILMKGTSTKLLLLLFIISVIVVHAAYKISDFVRTVTPYSSTVFVLSILNLLSILKTILQRLKWDSVSLAAWGEGIGHLSSAVTEARLGRIMVTSNSRGWGPRLSRWAMALSVS